MKVSFLLWFSVNSHVFEWQWWHSGLCWYPEDRMHSGGDILQDCISEHSSLTKTESDPPGDLSLPGKRFSIWDEEQKKALTRILLIKEEVIKMKDVSFLKLWTCTFRWKLRANQVFTKWRLVTVDWKLNIPSGTLAQCLSSLTLDFKAAILCALPLTCVLWCFCVLSTPLFCSLPSCLFLPSHFGQL